MDTPLFAIHTATVSDATQILGEGSIRLYNRLGYAVTGARRVSDRVTLVVLNRSAVTSR
jgi:hypothetical protein